MNCFTAYHCKGVLKNHKPELCALIRQLGKEKREGKRNQSKAAGNLDGMDLSHCLKGGK